MKTILGILLSLVLGAGLVHADVVDPTGDDNYKTLIVKIQQLDSRILPNGSTSRVDIKFGDQKIFVNTSDVELGRDVVKKITIPKKANGDFFVGVSTQQWSWMLASQNGRLDEGTKTVEVRLKRIDINPMLVTRPDGSTYWATIGKVQISLFNGDYTPNWNQISVFTMGLGLDVPVGNSYLVEVTAQTEDGTDFYKSTLDFRNL